MGRRIFTGPDQPDQKGSAMVGWFSGGAAVARGTS